MHRGYLPIWRKFFDEHPFWKKKRVFSEAEAWIDILRETHFDEEPKERFINGKMVRVNYGEAIMSTRYCGIRWGWHNSRVFRFFKLLQMMEQIEVKTEHKTNRIIVINYATYDIKQNAKQNEDRTQIERKQNANRTQIEQTKTCNTGNQLNIKRDKSLFVEDSEEFRLADLLFTEIRKNNPNFKTPNLQQWAGQVDLMIRIDKRVPEQIAQIIAWCQDNDFWKSNILSTQKLRKQYDQLLVKMNGSSKRQQYSETTRRNIESFKDWVPPEMRDR